MCRGELGIVIHQRRDGLAENDGWPRSFGMLNCHMTRRLQVYNHRGAISGKHGPSRATRPNRHRTGLQSPHPWDQTVIYAFGTTLWNDRLDNTPTASDTPPIALEATVVASWRPGPFRAQSLWLGPTSPHPFTLDVNSANQPLPATRLLRLVIYLRRSARPGNQTGQTVAFA